MIITFSEIELKYLILSINDIKLSVEYSAAYFSLLFTSIRTLKNFNVTLTSPIFFQVVEDPAEALVGVAEHPEAVE